MNINVRRKRDNDCSSPFILVSLHTAIIHRTMAYNIFVVLLFFYFFESRLVHFNWNARRDQTQTQTINRNSPFAYNNAVPYNKLIKEIVRGAKTIYIAGEWRDT